LLVLGSLVVVMTLKPTCLVLNIFYTSIFLGHYLDICYTLEHIIHG
jgi:hypothetical protein